LSLSWKANYTSKTLEFTLVFLGTAWIGFGVSPDGKMSQGDYTTFPWHHSDVILYRPEEDPVVKEFQVTGHCAKCFSPYNKDNAGVVNASHSQTNGVTTLSFSRPFIGAADDNYEINYYNNTWIWAYGSTNTWEKHVERGAITIAFVPEPGASTSSSVTFAIVHAVLMAMAVGIVLPVGAIFANRKRSDSSSIVYERGWVVTHRNMQVVACALATVAIGCAIYSKQLSGSRHFHSLHSYIGIGAYSVLFVQVITMLLSGNMYGNRSSSSEQLHTTAEWVTILGAAAAISLGALLPDIGFALIYVYAYLGAFGLLLVVVVGMELCRRYNGDDATMLYDTHSRDYEEPVTTRRTKPVFRPGQGYYIQ